MIKVLIVDDHRMILEGLNKVLNDTPGLEVTGQCSNAKECITAVKNHDIDVVLLDINLPDMNGIDLCKKIKTVNPELPCIALTSFGNQSYIQKMIQAGASGYLLKNASKKEIVDAIFTVLRGDIHIHVKNSSLNVSSKTLQDIPMVTPREKEVLSLISEGYTNKKIAEKLYVSVFTVNSHRKNLLRKFEVLNTAALIKKATLAGYVS